MKSALLLLSAFAALLLTIFASLNPNRQWFSWRSPAADLVVKNAKIYTVDKSLPFADSMAIRNGRILQIGSYSSIQVHLDHKHMGLAGDDSWSPCVHDDYLIPPVPSSFSIRLSPIIAATSGHDIYKSQLQL